jgi:hypothetical protein
MPRLQPSAAGIGEGQPTRATGIIAGMTKDEATQR